MNRPFSLRRRISLSIAVVTMLLALISSLAAGNTARRTLIANEGNALTAIARQTTGLLDRGMANRIRDLQVLAQFIEIEVEESLVSLAEQREPLEVLQRNFPDYAWIGIADLDGTVRVATDGLLEGVDISARDWFQRAQNAIYVGDVHSAALLTELLPSPEDDLLRLIDVAVPLRDRQGATVAILAAHIDWRWVQGITESVLAQTDPQARIAISILNVNTEILFDTAGAIRVPSQIRSAVTISSRRDLPQVELNWPDGEQHLSTFARSEGFEAFRSLGWVIVVRQPSAITLRPAAELQRQILLIGLGLGLIFTLIGAAYTSQLTRPLLRFAKRADRIRHGERGVRLPKRYPFLELQILGDALQALVEQLTDREDKLQAAAQSLEQRIAARTTELAESNTSLRREIIERTRVEQELRLQKALLERIIESSLDAVLVVSQDQRWLAYNRRFIDLWKFDEQVVAQAASRAAINSVLTQVSDPEAFQTRIGELYADEKMIALDELHLLDGRSFERYSAPVHTNDGRYYGRVWFYRDVTERRAVERAKSEFVSVVSHELRTPLTSIRGSLGLVLGGVIGELSPKSHTMLTIALRNCERLIELINDILDVEKLESGQMPMRIEPLDLSGLIQRALDEIAAFANTYQIRLSFAPLEQPVLVYVDGDRLIQVLTNLISNAIKFSPQGGEVRITLVRHPGLVRVSVSDDGQGIPEEFRTRIFQRFVQADSSNTRQKGGTGLGLSISRAIITQLGGTINYSSQVGVGTTFYFDLPLQD